MDNEDLDKHIYAFFRITVAIVFLLYFVFITDILAFITRNNSIYWIQLIVACIVILFVFSIITDKDETFQELINYVILGLVIVLIIAVGIHYLLSQYANDRIICVIIIETVDCFEIP